VFIQSPIVGNYFHTQSKLIKLPQLLNVSLAPNNLCHCSYNQLHALCYKDPLMEQILQMNYGLDFMTPREGFKGPNEQLAYEISNFMIPKSNKIIVQSDSSEAIHIPSINVPSNVSLSKSLSIPMVNMAPNSSNTSFHFIDILVIGGNIFMFVILAFLLFRCRLLIRKGFR